jgi:hypothetical protein
MKRLLAAAYAIAPSGGDGTGRRDATLVAAPPSKRLAGTSPAPRAGACGHFFTS